MRIEPRVGDANELVSEYDEGFTGEDARRNLLSSPYLYSHISRCISRYPTRGGGGREEQNGRWADDIGLKQEPSRLGQKPTAGVDQTPQRSDAPDLACAVLFNCNLHCFVC